MAAWELSSNSIPNDIALNIASFLEAPDVCSLGCCSKFWCDLCASSDCLWLDLCKKRWPNLDFNSQNSSSTFQGWRRFYINKHKSLALCASYVFKFVEEHTHNESLEVGYHLKAIADLRSFELGFKDVQHFFLARKHSVLLNLIGLHYSIVCLQTSTNDLAEALRTCQVSDRQVCISWFTLGRWFYGFRLADDHQSRKLSLGDLTTIRGTEVLGVLNRGAVHEVFRVQITPISTVIAQPSQIMASAS